MQQVFNPTNGFAIVLGQRLEVGYSCDSARSSANLDDTHLEWVPSRVEDLDAQAGRLVVAWPTDGYRRPISVEIGQEIEVAASNARDALYAVRGRVQRTAREPVPVLELTLTESWRRTQRRSAFRVRVAVRPRIANKVTGHAFKALRLGMTDISATGVQVRSQDELHPGDRLFFAFDLMGQPDEVTVEARVKRVQRLDRGGTGHMSWDAGCAFENLSDRLEQRIVQYIFAQQRALARAIKERAS
ncbi:MAG: hypothetical protein NVSMB2_02150 [Chloroflexota bacterium]